MSPGLPLPFGATSGVESIAEVGNLVSRAIHTGDSRAVGGGSETRDLTPSEEGLRALIAAGVLETATTDWGWTGLDATFLAVVVWIVLGWVIPPAAEALKRPVL